MTDIVDESGEGVGGPRPVSTDENVPPPHNQQLNGRDGSNKPAERQSPVPVHHQDSLPGYSEFVPGEPTSPTNEHEGRLNTIPSPTWEAGKIIITDATGMQWHVPCDSKPTPGQLQFVRHLQVVPSDEVMTYGEFGNQMGSGARAVGQYRDWCYRHINVLRQNGASVHMDKVDHNTPLDYMPCFDALNRIGSRASSRTNAEYTSANGVVYVSFATDKGPTELLEKFAQLRRERLDDSRPVIDDDIEETDAANHFAFVEAVPGATVMLGCLGIVPPLTYSCLYCPMIFLSVVNTSEEDYHVGMTFWSARFSHWERWVDALRNYIVGLGGPDAVLDQVSGASGSNVASQAPHMARPFGLTPVAPRAV